MCHDSKVYFHELKLNLLVCVYIFCVIGHYSPKKYELRDCFGIFWVLEPFFFVFYLL